MAWIARPYLGGIRRLGPMPVALPAIAPLARRAGSGPARRRRRRPRFRRHREDDPEAPWSRTRGMSASCSSGRRISTGRPIRPPAGCRGRRCRGPRHRAGGRGRSSRSRRARRSRPLGARASRAIRRGGCDTRSATGPVVELMLGVDRPKAAGTVEARCRAACAATRGRHPSDAPAPAHTRICETHVQCSVLQSIGRRLSSAQRSPGKNLGPRAAAALPAGVSDGISVAPTPFLSRRVCSRAACDSRTTYEE